MPTDIETCKNCHNAVTRNGQLVCHAAPPTPVAVPAVSGDPAMAVIAFWPNVPEEEWCGSFRAWDKGRL